jgi:signal transduction histidine kinase
MPTRETARTVSVAHGKALQPRLAAAFAGALTVVIALSLTVYETARSALASSRLVARAQEVLQVMNGVEGALVTAQSAVRGFVITGDGIYLRDRANALSALESRVQRLSDLTADSELQRRRWRALRDRLDQRVALLDRLVVIRQTEGADAAREFLRSVYPPPAPDMTGRIRAVTREMVEDEQRKLAEQVQEEERATAIAVAAGLGLTAVFVVLFTLAYVAIRRQVARTIGLNAALIGRTEEVEAANRELEAFSYSVSHDLRAPLRAIDGFSQMLIEDFAEPLGGEGARRLDVIRDNSRRMERLIDDLLDFARLGKKPLVCSTIDMTALAGDVYRELRAAHPEGEAEFDLAPLPKGWGDPAMLRQVLANLLSNALKYAGKDRVPRIEVSGRPDGSENVYCVKDNGVGFDMTYYDKLFGVFQRLHSEKEFSGTGVGLAIVQRVVQRHGGRVWAESKLDQGSSFYFSLPKASSVGSALSPATGGRK